MKTAMQIAVESYKNDGVSFTDWFIDNYEMLLKKEEEQIRKAYGTGYKNSSNYEEIGGIEYYNETYTK